MTLKDFVKSRHFLIQLGLACILAVIILWFSLKLLDIYTLHGRTITVPDLEGLYEEDVKTLLGKQRLNYTIQDSIYDETRKRGTVAAQEPFPGNEVKPGRTIYITMVAKLPEMVTVPDLTDLSLRQAIALLHNHGLKVGKLEYVPSIARNAVVEQRYNHRPVEQGTMLEKGTPINLILGEGLTSSRVPVPFVVGKTRQEALLELNRAALNLGNETYLDDDTVNVKVYRQRPNAINQDVYLNMGSRVDLTYRSVDEFDFDKYLEDLLMVDIPLLYGKTPEEAREIIEQSFLVVGREIYEFYVREEDARVHRQEPDYFDEIRVNRGARINLWYRALEDFDEE